MPLPRIHYRAVGQDDYRLIIDVATDGTYAIDSGDSTSHPPKHGQLDADHRARIEARIGALGEPTELPAPEGAEGFIGELTLGDGPKVRHYRFWEGALGQRPELKALIRELEVINA